MANAKPSATVEREAPTTTMACELGRCDACRGTIISATTAHGTPCQHDCHGEG